MPDERMDGPDLSRLIERLAADPRVYGLYRDLPHESVVERPEFPADTLRIVTTWDGCESIQEELRDLASLVVDLDGAAIDPDGRWLRAATSARPILRALHVVAADGSLLDLAAVRTSELEPGDLHGTKAEPLLDPKGFIAQWRDWAIGRERKLRDGAKRESEERRELQEHRNVVWEAQQLRHVAGVRRGLTVLRPGGRVTHPVGTWAQMLRREPRSLGTSPAAETVARQRDAFLSTFPQPAAGVRLSSGDGIWESFLAVADSEGFTGDRPLFDAARATLAEASGRKPTFEEGFCTATFDKVEGRFSLGDAIGGCKPPLVPGVVAGVAVSPADDLVFWAAPCVHPPGSSLACVADPGERVTLPRTAGRDALFGALTDAVAAAHDELPMLLRRARAAHHDVLDDPAAALKPLHLPRSFVLSTEAVGGLVAGTTRLLLALSLLRAGEDMEPLVAREFGRAAGRLLLTVEPVDAAACSPDP